jgi:hypothetical protein
VQLAVRHRNYDESTILEAVTVAELQHDLTG